MAPDSLARPPAFRMVKWYLDCVDDVGNAAIAYWVSLSWRNIGITWQRVTRYAVGQENRERTSISRAPSPLSSASRVTWHAPVISCDVSCDATAPPSEHRLLEAAEGTITWRCEAPAARVRIATADAPALEGTGYAERIELTLPPWRLPIDELRWGRWASADATRSIVWIDWRGPSPLTLVLLDGIVQPGATVGDQRVDLPAGSLCLDRPRTLHEESVGKVVDKIPGLRRALRKTPLSIRDDKWCASGTCRLNGESPLRGWAIHETVWFR